MLARRPGPSTIFVAVASKNPAVCRMRFVGRESRIDRSLGIGQCALNLLARFTREEIPRHDRAHLPSDARELLPRLWLMQSSELSFEGIEPPDRLRVFPCAIEQRSERLVLVCRLVRHRKKMSAAAAGPDLGRLGSKHRIGAK